MSRWSVWVVLSGCTAGSFTPEPAPRAPLRLASPAIGTADASLVLQGPAGSWLGFTVSVVGDLDGDGIDDAAFGGAEWAAYAGRLQVHLGTPAGLVATPDRTFIGANPGDSYGEEVRGGDFDGDGFDDLVVSVPGANEIHLFYGSAAGIGPAPDRVFAGAQYAAGAGDLDGDGNDELVLADFLYAASTGRVYVYAGSPAGVAATPAVTLDGENPGDLFGAGLGRIGDLDGDGDDELVLGAHAYGGWVGRAYVYDGGPGLVGTTPSVVLDAPVAVPYASFGGDLEGADLNLDGYGDLVIPDEGPTGGVNVWLGSASGIDTTPDLRVVPSGPGVVIEDAVIPGDVDLDGYPDVLLWAMGGDEAWLYPGGPGGIETAAVLRVDVGGQAVSWVSNGGGDLDGNGVADLLLGAPFGDQVYEWLAWPDDDDDGQWIGGPINPDCDDQDPSVFPGAVEIVGDGVDQDCDDAELCYADRDDDGFRTGELIPSADLDCDDPGEAVLSDPGGDCDDDDPAAHPSATELIGDGADQDCDGAEVCYVDQDRDGFRLTTTVLSADADCTDAGEALATQPVGDCADTQPTVYPGAVEVVADGIDQDCDGFDACWSDQDGDGWRTSTTVPSADSDCTDAGEAGASAPAGDCDDGDAAVNPGAVELAGDEVDQDCDGVELCYDDADLDGWRADTTHAVGGPFCDAPGDALATAPGVDCADHDPDVHPGAVEAVADRVDQDCDGGDTCLADADDDGFRTGLTVASADLDCLDPGEAGPAAPAGDCDDADPAVHPGTTELPGDGVDQDCDGAESCWADGDRDGFGGSALVGSADLDCADVGEATAGGDCDDADADAYPGAPERCDGVDTDCDGDPDAGATDAPTGVPDLDGDGFAGPGDPVTACALPEGFVVGAVDGDCDDADPAVFPGAADPSGDGVDQDCDGADGAAGAPKGGCGCDNGAPGAAGWLGVALGALIVRRRQPGSARCQPSDAERCASTA